MRRNTPSPLMRGLLVVCVVVLLGANTVGCACTADWCATFRDAANSSFQSGVTSIATGIINGIFAILNTGSDSASASASSTFSGSSSSGGNGGGT